ncbi:MAG: ATP-binding protein [Bdellovibrionales bacterium]
MRIFSFVRKGIDLEPMEVDLSLVPGMPNFFLIGLPDASIKESILRVKSALRHQGFKLPQKDLVIVHLIPSHEKKTSQGLDLAIVVAYLLKTGQIEISGLKDGQDLYLYGEVSLEGEVRTPQDLELLEELPANGYLITGAEVVASGGVGAKKSLGLPFMTGRVSNLQELKNIRWCEPQFDECGDFLASEGGSKNVAAAVASGFSDSLVLSDSISHFYDYEFAKPLAQLLEVAAAGEHNVFVAGPAGTGKTTFTQALHALLREPTVLERRKINKIARITGVENKGRPFISPHHGSSDIALLGGGVPPQPGEITRAQHGVLVLDEFLEYDSYVKESLREPIEKHEITVCRSGNKVTYPADFLMVATSNLCPCGDYSPLKEANCGFHSTHCKSYYKRLSGPLLDRFEMISFSHFWKKGACSRLSEIKERVVKAQHFAFRTRGQTKTNGRLTLKECESMTSNFTRNNLLPEVPASHRRLLALYRVARTLADIDSSEEILPRHFEGAKNFTIQPFQDLKMAWR